MCRTSENPIERIRAGVADLPAWTARQPDAARFGEPLIEMGELIDRLEAVRADLRPAACLVRRASPALLDAGRAHHAAEPGSRLSTAPSQGP